jgi:putative chitinase
MARFRETLAKVPKPVWYGVGALALILLFRKRKDVSAAASTVAERVAETARGLVGSLVTANSVRKAVPGVSLAQLPGYINPLVNALEEAQINNPARIAAFLAQLGHESSSFSRFIENLNYSADGLRATFPKYIKTAAEAAAYARKPEKIANRVYANRIGNGSESSGDGWKYRGRGPIQLTGKANYTQFTRDVGSKFGVDFVRNPDLVADPVWGFRAAAWYWNTRGLNALADRGEFDEITYRINGGYKGKEDRDKRFVLAKRALSEEQQLSRV